MGFEVDVIMNSYNTLQNVASNTNVYQYEHLPDASCHIRLFEILPDTPDSPLRLTLSVHTRQSSMSGVSSRYIALSYVWGLETPLEMIYVDDAPFFIRVNLHTFLLQLRALNSYDLLWADAICINQMDIEEKNQQVISMGSIYKQAVQIYAWIGDGTPETASLFHSVNTKDYRGVISWASQTEKGTITMDEVDALSNIWQRPYWERTWIVQELRCRPESVMLWCGKDSVPFMRLRRYHLESMNFLLSEDIMVLADLSKSVLGRRFQEGTLEVFGDLCTRFCEYSHSNQLRTLISHHRYSYCADSRDKIYAFRGLATDVGDDELLPEYRESVENLFWNVLGHITKRDILDLTDTGHAPVWGLVLKTLQLTLDDIKKHAGTKQSGIPADDSFFSRRFSQVIAYPARISQVDRSTSPNNYQFIEALSYPNYLEGPHPYAGIEYHGFTHTGAQEGDLLFRLLPACELSIIVRPFPEMKVSELTFIGWAVTAGKRREGSAHTDYIRTSVNAWCLIKGDTQGFIGFMHKEWLPKKLSLALQILQQSYDDSKDSISVAWHQDKPAETGSSPQIRLYLNVNALISLWEYSEHPDRHRDDGT